ncbi:MAG TPA: polyketide synthase dehydratase domain-containing protein [Smithellaceae bacterium]|jgi:hypothetical protein|nr:polyketide synthase dehydratase domain-containing protein [Syntrophaceae bacterium]HPV48758.1 polyketide synthase dehydratase domain-containing protein [Smithellaceae bacterium]
MAEIPQNNMSRRLKAILPVAPYLRDHHFEGKTVLPAVESLILLASIVGELHPRANLCHQADAQFPRLLAIDPAAQQVELQVDVKHWSVGIEASLCSLLKVKNSTMSRRLEHARVTFVNEDIPRLVSASPGEAFGQTGDCFFVSSDKIYRELIPFGAFYQNIIGELAVCEDRVLATISGGSGQADETLLGSPFVLDAAMHAASVWGQRYAGIVPFPVGIDRRIIHQATKKGKNHLARIVPTATDGELCFDVWIFAQDGVLCESIKGLRMRDITRGRMSPPGWISEGAWKKF